MGFFRIWLLGKLFVLMGFSWIFEILSELVFGENERSNWWLILPDVFNALQSFSLFYIFVLKKDIKDQLGHRFNNFNGNSLFKVLKLLFAYVYPKLIS